MTKQADIRICTLSRHYYIGSGCCRLRGEFKTFAGAVRSAERQGYTVTNKSVDPMVEFKANDGKTKIVESLVGGKLVRIAVNTPRCCDPSSELYWTM